MDEISHFKRLELSLGDINEWQMGALQSLQGLFFGFGRTEDVPKIISTINHFTQLKSLQLLMPKYDYSYERNELNLTLVCPSLSQKLPNLEEVHLIVPIISDDHFEFVARSPKLSKLVFRLTSSSQIVSSYENVRDRMDSLIEMRDNYQTLAKWLFMYAKNGNPKKLRNFSRCLGFTRTIW